MTRTFQDADLLVWEVYAAAPRSGAGHGARLVFHCTSDPDRRARVLETDGDRTSAAKEAASVSDQELRARLEAASPLD